MLTEERIRELAESGCEGCRLLGDEADRLRNTLTYMAERVRKAANAIDFLVTG